MLIDVRGEIVVCHVNGLNIIGGRFLFLISLVPLYKMKIVFRFFVLENQMYNEKISLISYACKITKIYGIVDKLCKK